MFKSEYGKIESLIGHMLIRSIRQCTLHFTGSQQRSTGPHRKIVSTSVDNAISAHPLSLPTAVSTTASDSTQTNHAPTVPPHHSSSIAHTCVAHTQAGTACW